MLFMYSEDETRLTLTDFAGQDQSRAIRTLVTDSLKKKPRKSPWVRFDTIFDTQYHLSTNIQTCQSWERPIIAITQCHENKPHIGPHSQTAHLHIWHVNIFVLKFCAYSVNKFRTASDHVYTQMDELWGFFFNKKMHKLKSFMKTNKKKSCAIKFVHVIPWHVLHLACKTLRNSPDLLQYSGLRATWDVCQDSDSHISGTGDEKSRLKTILTIYKKSFVLSVTCVVGHWSSTNTTGLAHAIILK